MPSPGPVVLLALETTGGHLRVSARRRELVAPEERWFDLDIDAAGHPFRGAVTDVVTQSDLVAFRADLAEFVPPGEVLLGGGRAAELRLEIEPMSGSAGDLWVVEATLTPSGDDPYPLLRWLLFDQRPFMQEAVRAIDALLAP